MDRRQKSYAAGIKLRRLREDAHLTQAHVEKLTGERFGRENRVYAQQVSRIESGALNKPPILDLLRYGQLLGLTADDIAEMYDLWPRGAGKAMDPRLQQAVELAEELSGLDRERFLEWVRFAVLQAKADQRTKERAATEPGREPEPERVR